MSGGWVVVGVMGVIVVAGLTLHIYLSLTGVPVRQRGGGFETPDGIRRDWLLGVDKTDGTRTVRRRTGTWYEMRRWAEHQSNTYGTALAWIRSEADADDEVRIWTWRNGDRWDRYRRYLWDLPDYQLMAGEWARIDARARKMSGEES